MVGTAEERKGMIESLKRLTIPVLRESGFRGKFPHFYRIGDARTDLLTFQFDKYGGGFVTEISSAPPGDFDTGWGEVVPPNKLHVAHMSPSDRFRLGAKRPDGDHWFRYDRGKLFRRRPSFDELASHVAELITSQGEDWWNSSTPVGGNS